MGLGLGRSNLGVQGLQGSGSRITVQGVGCDVKRETLRDPTGMHGCVPFALIQTILLNTSKSQSVETFHFGCRGVWRRRVNHDLGCSMVMIVKG